MKKIVTFLLLIFSLNIVAQSKSEIREKNTKFAVTFTQDFKLAVKKDDAGNEPFTLDLTGKMEWRTYSTKIGYFSLIPNFEYAELKGGDYLSYGVWVGFTFDEWLEIPTFGLLNKRFLDLDIMPYVGFSKIMRKWADTYNNSYELTGTALVLGVEVTLKIHDRIGLVVDFKLVDRQDLKVKYDSFDELMSPNVGVGIKYEF